MPWIMDWGVEGGQEVWVPEDSGALSGEGAATVVRGDSKYGKPGEYITDVSGGVDGTPTYNMAGRGQLEKFQTEIPGAENWFSTDAAGMLAQSIYNNNGGSGDVGDPGKFLSQYSPEELNEQWSYLHHALTQGGNAKRYAHLPKTWDEVQSQGGQVAMFKAPQESHGVLGDALRDSVDFFTSEAMMLPMMFAGGLAMQGAAPAAAGATGTAGGAMSQAELAALIESGTVGTAGAGLEAAALGTAGALGTGAMSQADLAQLIESGTVGEAGAALEGAAGIGEAAGALGGASQADLAQLVESGTVGDAGAALENAALEGFGGTAGAGAMTQADLAQLIESGTVGEAGGALETLGGVSATGAAAGAGVLDTLTQFGSDAMDAGKKLLGGDMSALKSLLKLGVPVAAIAGLFEKNESPLIGPMTDAARGALAQADKFAGMTPSGLSPSQLKAIESANANAGAGQALLERSGALADTAAAGIDPDQITRYMNPELDAVLKTTIRDIEEAAARRRQQLQSRVARSGNDFRTPVEGGNRFNIEDDLLDRSMFQEIGDTTGALRANAWNTAAGLAGKDLDRTVQASALYGHNAKTSGALGAVDFANLDAAGALEKSPENAQRQHVADSANLYTGALRGTAPAIDATKQPSTLRNVAGALGVLGEYSEKGAIGALKSAKDIGLY